MQRMAGTSILMVPGFRTKMADAPALMVQMPRALVCSGYLRLVIGILVRMTHTHRNGMTRVGWSLLTILDGIN